MSDEIRRDQDPRIFFDESIELYAFGNRMLGRAVNLSLGGVFVQAPQLLPAATRLTVRMGLPDDEGLPIDARTTVVRQVCSRDSGEQPGMALRFDVLDSAALVRVERFIAHRIQPASGQSVRLRLGKLGFPITARAHSAWDNIVSVDAELPFLQLGTPVSVPVPARGDDAADGQGSIRWVSVHVPPETGIPRINIGIEVDAPTDVDEDCVFIDDELEWYDDELDPVCTADFADHAHRYDRALRAARKAASQ